MIMARGQRRAGPQPPGAPPPQPHLHDPTPLERRRVRATYAASARACLAACLVWLVAVPYDTSAFGTDAIVSDALLAIYVHHLYSSGAKLWRARGAILGLQHAHRALRGHLPRAWESIKTWQRMVTLYPKRARWLIGLAVLCRLCFYALL